MFPSHEHQCYGTGTVGEKGQIVIPAKARDALNIIAGEELIFFGHEKMMHMIKAKELNEFLDKLTAKFNNHVAGIKAKIKK